jgi:hypothetical protein
MYVHLYRGKSCRRAPFNIKWFVREMKETIQIYIGLPTSVKVSLRLWFSPWFSLSESIVELMDRTL